jgi:hypothetical protein
LSMDENLQMIGKIAAVCNDASIAHSEHQYVATGMPTEAALKVRFVHVIKIPFIWDAVIVKLFFLLM